MVSETTRDSSRNTSPRLPVRNIGATFSGRACRRQDWLFRSVPSSPCILCIYVSQNCTLIFFFLHHSQMLFHALSARRGKGLTERMKDASGPAASGHSEGFSFAVATPMTSISTYRRHKTSWWWRVLCRL